jgi:hypothetical protein
VVDVPPLDENVPPGDPSFGVPLAPENPPLALAPPVPAPLDDERPALLALPQAVIDAAATSSKDMGKRIARRYHVRRGDQKGRRLPRRG